MESVNALPHPGRGGHPREVRDRLTELVGDGVSVEDAARRVGVSPRQAYRWTKDAGGVQAIRQAAALGPSAQVVAAVAGLRDVDRAYDVEATELQSRARHLQDDQRRVESELDGLDKQLRRSNETVERVAQEFEALRLKLSCDDCDGKWADCQGIPQVAALRAELAQVRADSEAWDERRSAIRDAHLALSGRLDALRVDAAAHTRRFRRRYAAALQNVAAAAHVDTGEFLKDPRFVDHWTAKLEVTKQELAALLEGGDGAGADD